MHERWPAGGTQIWRLGVNTHLNSALLLNLKAPMLNVSIFWIGLWGTQLTCSSIPAHAGTLGCSRHSKLFLKSAFSHFWKDSTPLRSSTHLKPILILDSTSYKHSQYMLLRLAHKQQEIRVHTLGSKKMTLGHSNLIPLISTVLQVEARGRNTHLLF